MCSYHNTNSHLDEGCYQQIEKSGKFKNGRQKWCSFNNNNDHANEGCYQQKNRCKFKVSSTVDNKSSRNPRNVCS